MPKLQRNNDKNLLNEDAETSNRSQYILCIRRRCHPRLHVLICDQCRYRKKCAEYQCFKQGIGKEEFKESTRKRKRRIRRKVY